MGEEDQQVQAASVRRVRQGQGLMAAQKVQGPDALGEHWVWVGQEDAPHAAVGLLQDDRQYRQGAGDAPYAEPHLRRRDCPQRVLAEEEGDGGAGEAAEHQGAEWEREAQVGGERVSLARASMRMAL